MVKELNPEQKIVLSFLSNRIVELKSQTAILENERANYVQYCRKMLEIPADWIFDTNSLAFVASQPPPQPQEEEGKS